jgi:phage terminase large subunit-like protein
MTPAAELALVDRFRRLPRAAREATYALFYKTPGRLADLRHDWLFWARPDQLVSPAELRGQKLVVFTGLRGAGKTRAAVQLFIQRIIEGKARRPRIVAATEGDVDKTVVHGPSGIMACCPPEHRPIWVKTDGLAGVLRFPNGVEVLCYSAAKPEQITGSAGDCDLYDDFAKWGSTGELAWRNARYSCREGDGLGILATTRRGIVILRKYLKGDVTGVLVRRPPDVGANDNNLAVGHRAQMAAEDGESDYFRQEMEDEDVSSESPFHGIDFDHAPIRVLQALRSEFAEIAIAVDPADGKGGDHDDWGIGAAGRRHDRHVVGIEDATDQYTDAEAGDKALELADRWGARAFVVEKNRGERRIVAVLQAAHYKRLLEQGAEKIRPLPEIIAVTARELKKLRAGPLRGLYLQGLLHHTTGMAKVEKQQRAWDPDGPKRPRQDDAIDWWVHAVHHLADLGAVNDALQLDEVEGLAERTRAAQATIGAHEAPRMPGVSAMARTPLHQRRSRL